MQGIMDKDTVDCDVLFSTWGNLHVREHSEGVLGIWQAALDREKGIDLYDTQ